MHIDRNIKAKILSGYKQLAMDLYRDRDIIIDRDTLRLAIAQTIIEHVLTQERDALTTARRVTKNKITKAVKKEKIKERIDNGEVPDTIEISF